MTIICLIPFRNLKLSLKVFSIIHNGLKIMIQVNLYQTLLVMMVGMINLRQVDKKSKLAILAAFLKKSLKKAIRHDKVKGILEPTVAEIEVLIIAVVVTIVTESQMMLVVKEFLHLHL